MNICIVSSLKMGLCMGGIESVCYYLGKEIIKEEQHKLYQLYLHRPDTPETPGVNYMQIPPLNSTVEATKIIRDFIKQYNIDIIWNHTMNVPLIRILRQACNESHTKLVSVYHTAPNTALCELRETYAHAKLTQDFGKCMRLAFFYPRNWFGVYRKCRTELCSIAELSDYVYLLSEAYIKEYKRICLRNYRNLRYMANPIEISPGHCPKTQKKNQVLVVSRHVWKHKRIDRIIRIWKEIEGSYPDWQLIILGDGDAHEDYINLARKLNVKNVIFKGMVSPDSYYKESKIICLTSGWEGLPMVLIEAQKHGCVPVSYKSFAALPDIITNGETGYMIPPFHKHKFKDKLVYLMTHEHELEIMAEKCRLHSENFKSDLIAKSWLNQFKNIMSNTL